MISTKTVADELAKTNKEEEEILKTLNIGAIAKRKRLELHLSQKEVSDEICSISYLSKIETNKIIPNSSCLNLLMERIHLSKYEVYLLENSQEILDKALIFIYNMDFDSYNELFNEMKDIKNNQYADVIRLGYYVMIEDTVNARKIINENMRLITSMDNFYIKAFSLFSCETLLLEHNYIDSNRILKSIKDTESKSEIFKILVKDYCFRLYQEEKRKVLAGRIYHELLNYYSANAHIKRIIKIKLIFIRMLFDDSEYEEVVLNGLNQAFNFELENNLEFVYIMAKSLKNLKKEFQAKEYFERLKDTEYKKFILDELYEYSDEPNEFIELIEKENSINPNFYYKYFLDKINRRDIKDIFQSDEFRELLDNSSQTEKIYLLSLERNFLTETSKYKEANRIASKIISIENGTSDK